MSDHSSSSAGAAPQVPDIPSVFSPFDQAPKPASCFPEANGAMYTTYLENWFARIEEYNAFAGSCKSYYETFAAGAHPDILSFLQLLSWEVSKEREVLMVDLDELELDLHLAGE